MKKKEILNIEGSEYRTEFNKKFINRKPYEKYNPKKVYSYIPGTIRTLFVKPGDKVAEGDGLLILEAMKMNNRIEATYAGTIKKIHVKPGQAIRKGELMIEYR